MKQEFIKVLDLARTLGRDRSSLLRALKKSGVEVNYVYDGSSQELRGQKVAVVRASDAMRFRVERGWE